MNANLLHVIAVINNPVRWQSRVNLFKDFVDHMLAAGVQLTVVEATYGDIPPVFSRFEPPEVPINYIRVQAKTQVWIKENLINIGLSRLPPDWRYVAWIDADIVFRRPDWAQEIVYALQHFDIIQPWSDCYDLGPNGEHLQHHKSFGHNWVEKPEIVGKGAPYQFSHPGYAWAATRHALESLGGLSLVEHAILGAGDHHLALALVNKVKMSIPGNIHPNYVKPLLELERRAQTHISGNLGYIAGTIEHLWHGSKDLRKYVDRWQILTKHKFDPEVDIKKNVWGVTELIGNKPEFRAALHKYHRQRNEDSNSL
jgi:hypothetical protein